MSFRYRLRPAALSLVLLASSALAPLGAGAQELLLTAENRRSLVLTVYNQNLGLVSETRRIELPAGETLVAIEDVPSQIQPETVLLAAPGLRIIEQSLAGDLLTPERLLEASLGQTIQIIRTNLMTGEQQVQEARVLSIAGDVVLQVGNRIETLSPNNPFTRIAFTSLPPGLRSEPALLARVFPGQAGPNDLRIDYLTGGLSWQADYVVRLNRTGDYLDLQALVTLSNTTDSSFEGAALRLVAGEVNQGPRTFKGQEMFMRGQAAVAMAPAADMSQAVAAGDRYVYTLAQPVTLRRGETKQIPLLTAQNVRVVQEYRFEGLASGHPGPEEIGPVNAALVLELANDADLGLGAPLPAGTLRVYGPGGENGAPLFLGADGIGHTPEGEKARITLGAAFDVTARAERTAYERLSDRSYETGQQITVRNAKSEAVEVAVVGDMPPGWSLREESHPHEPESANRVLWRIEVPAGGETVLTYRVRVSN
ncbi:MAG: DUF4139 domain-containing protein [Bacteroidota bacterium]|nr:DUF4139 domain-containing protein [Kiloniellaceae bacterium]